MSFSSAVPTVQIWRAAEAGRYAGKCKEQHLFSLTNFINELSGNSQSNKSIDEWNEFIEENGQFFIENFDKVSIYLLNEAPISRQLYINIFCIMREFEFDYDEFIVQILSRLYEKLEDDLINKELHSAIQEFDFFDEWEETPLSNSILDLVNQYLLSSNSTLRNLSLQLVCSYIDPNRHEIISTLNNLRSSKDWRTRALSVCALNRLKGRDIYSGLYLFDKIRVKYLDLYKTA